MGWYYWVKLNKLLVKNGENDFYVDLIGLIFMFIKYLNFELFLGIFLWSYILILIIC